MTAAAKLLLGFDQNGQVFDAGHLIHRRIRDTYKQRAATLFRQYKTHGLERKGIVETTLRSDGSLEHRKLTVSYPYEWPANMYKDAVLFHLRLLSSLEEAGLTLKDALPNNILFDHTHPVFVDFLSLVPLEHLRDERWLDATRYADPRYAVMNWMFFPYMILPLLFFGRQQPETARELLSSRSCNCDGLPPSWRELVRPPSRRPGWLRDYFESLYLAARVAPDWYSGKKRAPGAFHRLIDKLTALVTALDVTPLKSGYSSYYDEKKEALSLADHAAFLPKQKAILEILSARRPASVLDVGANTGWFSNLAEQLGASVIALEEDESCVDILYGTAKAHGRRILPLRLSFADLTKEIYGSAALAVEYADRGVGENPLYRAGVDRFDAHLALVLGLLHHLVLGEGRSIDDVLGILSRLARKTLVLEFVSLDDEKIRGEPEFFPSLRKFDMSTYNLELLLQAGRRHFSNAEVRTSHPATRTIVVFDR